MKRSNARSTRRRGIELKISELNVVTGDHFLLNIYKEQNVESIAPDLSTKVVRVTHSSLLKQDARGFVSPSKERGNGKGDRGKEKKQF